MTSPAWLGIGAQRSGTTWLTDLLCQHPSVGLGNNGKKEQHLLHKVGDGVEPLSAYTSLFPDDGIARGEWTPQYLRHSSAPFTAARVLGPDAPVLAILRDPVERFLSAMRLAATRAKAPWPYPVPITVQTFSGFYADQLAMWANAVGRDRMLVLVYEEVRRDPQAAADRVWAALGRTPVRLQDVDRPSRSSSHASWTPPEGLVESLRVLYRPQVERLATDWDLDVSSWQTVRA
ncbi:sulfotransferase family protein [Nocardioides campestrisoli]|uniref:sulfotransferase family protein n=1 Tax=Nocardioides campestrisoli TaxID=2736757 RepID=UPI0015E7E23F|nr:sulfotransferase [Nocardioides campestrisoli]